MTNTNQCNIKEPHSHLVNGQTFECEKGQPHIQSQTMPVTNIEKDSVQDIEIAKLFHDTYEKLAPDFGYETRVDTKEFDPFSPNGRLMIEVCRIVSDTLLQTEQTRIAEEVEKLNNIYPPNSEREILAQQQIKEQVLSIIKQGK